MRVISFSLYGKNPAYRRGALENLALARSVYPGWICRFYLSQEIPEDIAGQLRAGGGQVVRRQRRFEADGMFWRFEAAADPEASVLIVRDADSVLGGREKSAVDEWLASDCDFHIMRDHPHHTKPIMGGMWGARRRALRRIGEIISASDSPLRKRGDDQRFLAREIYPQVLPDALIHSECALFFGEPSRPFPSPRRGLDFVGERSFGLPSGKDILARHIAGKIEVAAKIFPRPSRLSRRYWAYKIWRIKIRRAGKRRAIAPAAGV